MTLADFFLLPVALPLLLIAPLGWIAMLARDRARARRLLHAVGARAATLAAELDGGRRQLARTFVAAAILFALAAVLQPLWGDGEHKVVPRGVDIVVCLDVSRSMLARDVMPSRLAAARQQIRALAGRARGDRIGLVVFGGEAQVFAPLTEDMDSFVGLLELADPLSVRRGGTDIGAALGAALGALGGATGDHEAVVLVTDGEDLERQGLRAADECRARNVVVHAVGLGSATGSKIPIEADRGETFLRDRSGREVVTASDASSLARIAEVTSGEHVDGGRPSALADLYDRRILPMARTSFEARASRERANRFQWPLVLALALWLLDFGASHRRRS